MTVPLAALARRVSRMAEQMFAKQGDIDPIWLIETAGGEQRTLVSPIYASSPVDAANFKDLLAEKAREMFAELNVARYARAMECWTAPRLDPNMTDEQVALRYAALGYTLANHPDRREVVLIEAED